MDIELTTFRQLGAALANCTMASFGEKSQISIIYQLNLISTC